MSEQTPGVVTADVWDALVGHPVSYTRNEEIAIRARDKAGAAKDGVETHSLRDALANVNLTGAIKHFNGDVRQLGNEELQTALAALNANEVAKGGRGGPA